MQRSLRRRATLSPATVKACLGVIAGVLATASPAAAQQVTPRIKPQQQEKAPVRTGPVEQQFPFGATWILSDIGGRSITGDAPSFTLDDKLRAVGFGGCNTFSMALYPIREQKLAAGAIALTRKTCGKDVDATEHDMLVTLHSLPKWHLESNGDLTVIATNSTTTMRFKRGL